MPERCGRGRSYRLARAAASEGTAGSRGRREAVSWPTLRRPQAAVHTAEEEEGFQREKIARKGDLALGRSEPPLSSFLLPRSYSYYPSASIKISLN